jgi:hypothetical protein
MVTAPPGNLLRHNATGKVSNRTGTRPLEQMKVAVDELLQ